MLRAVLQTQARLNSRVVFARSIQTKTVRPWSTHRLTSAPAATSPAPKQAEVPEKAAAPKPEVESKPKRRPLKPRKAAITLTPSALDHLRSLLDSPTPKLIRIGVRNRGCSGLIYHLEYVEKPGKFDEEVVQDGVKVLIDSKALFSVIGSEMDWKDDKLASRFVFNNPNAKGECGCGESFMV